MSRLEIIRFLVSAIAGPAVAFLVWLGFTSFGRPFIGMSVLGLVPVVSAGIVGGAVSALTAPSHKLQFAIVIGVIMGGILLFIMFSGGRYPLNGRNPFFWYWPAWLIPCFVVGGMLGKIINMSYNK